MVSRKVNRVGPSTLTVSLPSKWAKEHGIKKGAEIDVIEDGSLLTLRAKGYRDTPKRAEIHLSHGQQFMRRYLNVMYRDGYDEIEVTSDDPLDMGTVKKAVAELLGFEVVELHQKRIVVRNIATPNVGEFDNLFRRLFLLTIGMMESAIHDMRSGSFDHVTEIADLEATSNKFMMCCQRMLVRSDIKSRVWTLNLFRFAGELEEIADHIKKICLVISEHKVHVSRPILDTSTSCLLLLRALYETFYKPDPGRITTLRAERDKVFAQTYSLLLQKTLLGAEVPVASLILSVLFSIQAIETEMYHV